MHCCRLPWNNNIRHAVQPLLTQQLSCINHSPVCQRLPGILVCSRRGFYEEDKKGAGYPFKRSIWKELLKKENYQDVLPLLRGEFGKLLKEIKDHFRNDPVLFYRHNEVDIWWRFKTEEDFDKWMVTTDSDLEVGKSTASLTISPQGHALFSGNLCTEVPQDGKVKRTGFANLGSMRALKSFGRDSQYDWSSYTHLVIRARGDGRPYMINMHINTDTDICWFDIYHFVLFTRGGPYWQTAKIPLSKFFLGSKGRIQDHQPPPPLDKIMKLSFTIGEGNKAGPFSLEIQYIGLTMDRLHTEETAYEMYKVPPFLIGH